jgi:phosphoglycolate phosphatase
MSWPKAILFDLDGTLIDSAPDLARSVNAILAREGLGPLEVEAVRNMIGNGIRKLVERAFEACGVVLEAHELDEHEGSMVVIYAHNLTVETILYPAVRDALDRVQRRGIRTGVVTNKPIGATRAILGHFGIVDSFGAIIGGDEDIPRKPAPDPLWAALDQLGVMRDQALMVGDSAADVAAARAAGVSVVAVSGGYSTTPADALGADHAIGSLAELDDLIATWR